MKNKTKPIRRPSNFLKQMLLISFLFLSLFSKSFAQKTTTNSNDVSSAVSTTDAQIKALKAKLAILKQDLADVKVKSVSVDSTVVLSDDEIAKIKLAKDEKIKSLSLQIADIKDQLRKLGAPEPEMDDDSTLNGDIITSEPKAVEPTK